MSKTWRDGYVPGKAKKTIHLTDEVAKALEVRAAEERVRQAEIVERALRKELDIMEKRTYMCYTCNGDFETGYWLDTGEAEELFYCDECAEEVRITDSEHARRQLPEPHTLQTE